MNAWDQRRAEQDALIVGRLQATGRVIRRDLRVRFKVSETHAANIFTRFRNDYPDAMIYDLTIKGYVPGPRFADHFPDSQQRN